MVPEWLIIDFIPKIEILEKILYFKIKRTRNFFIFFFENSLFLILRILNWNRPGIDLE